MSSRTRYGRVARAASAVVLAATTSSALAASAAVASPTAAPAWRLQTGPALGTDPDLKGVSCVPSGTTTRVCEAVGRVSTGVLTTGAAAIGWDGSRWRAQAAPRRGGAQSETFLTDVACVSAVSCVAVGSFITDVRTGVVQTMAERWDGTSWTLEVTPDPGGTGGTYLDGVACAGRTCFAVGNREHWNGVAWAVQTTPRTGTGAAMTAISCPKGGRPECTASGQRSTTTQLGLNLVEHWDGVAWTIQPTPNPVSLTHVADVSCTAASSCTAVASGYAILAQN